MYRAISFIVIFVFVLVISSCKTSADSENNEKEIAKRGRGVWHGTASSDSRAIGIYRVDNPDATGSTCKTQGKVPLEIVCTAVAACSNMLVTIGHCIEDTKDGIATKASGFTTKAVISTQDEPSCALPPPAQYHWTDKSDDPKNPRSVLYPNPDDITAKDGITAVYLDTPLPAGTPFVEFETYEFQKGDKGTIVGYGENILKGWSNDDTQ